jgi:hypothetical protein
MRYYDPLLRIIIENLSEKTWDVLDVKNNVAYTVHYDVDFKTKILERFGLSGDTKGKLSYKFNVINKRAPYEINHNESIHILAL